MLEQIAQLQRDLDDTQREYFIETTGDALDKELKGFEDQQDAKISEIRAFLDDNEALNRAALDRLENMNQGLFDDLLSYALRYTDTTRAELEGMWDAAAKAAERYGGITSALTSMDEGIGREAQAGAMVAEMKYNARRWHTAPDGAKADLVNANEEIAARLGELLGAEVRRDGKGVWWIDGKELFKVYHKGTPSVGRPPTLKQKETFAKLEEGEAVYTERQQDVLDQLLDRDAIRELIDSGELYRRLIERGDEMRGNYLRSEMEKRSAMNLGNTPAPQQPVAFPNMDASVHIYGYADDNIMETLKNHPRQVAEIVARQFRP